MYIFVHNFLIFSKDEDEMASRERLQRRIHELEVERSRILVEKQILEENVRAEHRLADKLISQTLHRHYRNRHSSQKHRQVDR